MDGTNPGTSKFLDQRNAKHGFWFYQNINLLSFPKRVFLWK